MWDGGICKARRLRDGKFLANRHPDTRETEQSNRNAEQEKQVLGCLFREGVRQGDAAFAERSAECEVLFTQEVGHLDVKQSKGKPEENASEFEWHEKNLEQ